jgi:syntaxin 8
LEKRI